MSSEIAERFGDVRDALDSAFATLENSDEWPDFEVRDLSNLSGFDKSGFPYYLWSKLLIRDRNVDGETWRVAVQITYLEPLEATERRVLQIESKAEVFQRGSRSRVDRRSEKIVSIDEARERFSEIVADAWSEAEAALGRTSG